MWVHTSLFKKGRFQTYFIYSIRWTWTCRSIDTDRAMLKCRCGRARLTFTVSPCAPQGRAMMRRWTSSRSASCCVRWVLVCCKRSEKCLCPHQAVGLCLTRNTVSYTVITKPQPEEAVGGEAVVGSVCVLLWFREAQRREQTWRCFLCSESLSPLQLRL